MVRSHTPDDSALVARVLEGDRSAFEEIMSRHQRTMLKIIARRVKPDQVEDVLQDTFIRAYQSLAGFSGSKPLENWLSRIALRACYDHWRQEYRNRVVNLKSSLNRIGEAVERLAMNKAIKDHSEKQNARDARDVLNWALGQLAPADRMVLTLTHLDGYTSPEAAALIGWSKVNVKVRAFRARNKLRSLLTKALNKTGYYHE